MTFDILQRAVIPGERSEDPESIVEHRRPSMDPGSARLKPLVQDDGVDPHETA